MTTTTDHPDLILSDRRHAIMAAVAEVIEADEAAARHRHLAEATKAVEAVLPHISRLIESYGADPTEGITSGPCTDPAHALAWVQTAAGFTFEVTHERRRSFEQEPRYGCWLLHPETGERVYRVDQFATWEHAARAIWEASPDNLAPTPEPERRDHPADVLVDALRELIRSTCEPTEGGF